VNFFREFITLHWAAKILSKLFKNRSAPVKKGSATKGIQKWATYHKFLIICKDELS